MLNLKIISQIIILLILSTIDHSFGQEVDKNAIGSVLKKDKIDSLFIFNSSSINDHNELRIKYLGSLKSKKRKRFKIISYCWIWGEAQRATNSILVYNISNKYIGCYRVDMIDELPENIKNNRLIFNIQGNKKSESIRIPISFEKGVPKEIEIKNRNSYHFEKAIIFRNLH